MKIKISLVLTLLYFFFLIGCVGEESLGREESSGLAISDDVEFGEEDYRKIVSPSNKLGFEILSKVKGNDEGNIFISPTSLFMAMSMVYNGADGETKEEMARTMHVDGMDATSVNKANASLLNMLHQNSDQVQLNVANSIWLSKDYHFQSEFKQNTVDYFNAEIEEINMADLKSLDIINDWVEKSTNGKIEKIVEDPLDPKRASMLLNAIYFKGGWTDEFDEELTEDRTFYLEDGSKKEVPLMSLKESFPYFENELFQAISLPYGEKEKMSMKVFLPKEGQSLKDLQNMLTIENWEQWMGEFQHKEGTIRLPRFQVEYEVILTKALKELGMSKAFDGKSANFLKMIQGDVPVWISGVKQKTILEVNEKGAEAVAVTSIGTDGAEPISEEPFVMEVNRPFFVAITDDHTGTVLFTGLMFDPS